MILSYESTAKLRFYLKATLGIVLFGVIWILAGCASASRDIIILRPPEAFLNLPNTPAIPVTPATNTQIADYIISLKFSENQCHQQMELIRKWLIK